MPATILISGLLEYDSGKTWFSIGLAALAKRRGLRVALYKPVAGHSFWNRFGSVIESKKRRVLVGNDVLSYERYLGLNERLDLVNPIDLLTIYPDPLMLRGQSEYMLAVSSLERSLVLARISRCNGNGIVSRHFVFNENLSYAPVAARKELVELSRILGAEPATSKRFLQDLSSTSVSSVLEKCRERISTGKDLVIIESFSDSLLPYGGVERVVDLLIIVAPGKAIVFTGDKLRQAIELLGDMSVRTGSMLSIARYSSRVVIDVPPVDSPIKLAERLEDTRLASLLG